MGETCKRCEKILRYFEKRRTPQSRVIIENLLPQIEHYNSSKLKHDILILYFKCPVCGFSWKKAERST